MKKKLLTIGLLVTSCVALIGCGKKDSRKQLFGKDSKDIYSVIDQYLEGYCQADVGKVNALCVPKDVESSVKLLDENRLLNSEYPNVSFQVYTGMSNSASRLAATDYLKVYNWDETKKYLVDYGNKKITTEYDIKEVKHKGEVDKLYYRNVLSTVEAPADDYIDELTGLKVEDYYVISADIDWFYDGVKYGYDEKEINDILNKIFDDEKMVKEEADTLHKLLDQADETTTTFVVYKYNGNWYVYSGFIIIDSYVHRVSLVNE